MIDYSYIIYCLLMIAVSFNQGQLMSETLRPSIKFVVSLLNATTLIGAIFMIGTEIYDQKPPTKIIVDEPEEIDTH